MSIHTVARMTFAVAFSLYVTPLLAQSNSVPSDYRLVWSDEFNGNGLPDPQKWVYDTEANKTGRYNNEKQYYAVKRIETTKVENGKLVTARGKG